MNTVTISRRRFAHLLGAGAATALAGPAFTFARTPQAAPVRNGIIRLSSNENPYGPSPKALSAMKEAFALSCRYPDEHADALLATLAKENGVEAEQILLGNGSGEILKLCAAAFTGPGNSKIGRGPLVVADPTFEAIVKHASVNGAEIVKLPLTDTFAHDLAKMAAAATGGLVYVCNPNNPTASTTPKEELRQFISDLPGETMILVDEAYFHYADSPEYESVIPLIDDHPNLIVARTFSKIYGMAGLRCGFAIAQPEAIEGMQAEQPWDSVNIMALVAARASLEDAKQVTDGRRLNRDAKTFVLRELERLGYESIPSQANFIMVDMKRLVAPLLQDMKQRKVQVGRLFPALPNHMRVTIGTQREMEAFLSAFREVLA